MENSLQGSSPLWPPLPGKAIKAIFFSFTQNSVTFLFGTCSLFYNKFFCFCFWFFFGGGWSFGATPMAYGSSQARGWITAIAADVCHSHSNAGSEPHLWATSVSHTTAHGNTGSYTHWASPGTESVSSWMLVRLVSAEPQRELLQ